MRAKMVSFLRKAIADQSGQSMVMVVLSMFFLCGMAGLTLDVGHAYVVRTQIQNAVNAAGLASAEYIYNTQTANSDDAITIAKSYLSQNPIPGLSPTPSAATVCLNALLPSGTTCTSSTLPNAIKVAEWVSVPTTFMRIFGLTHMNVSATAMASWGTSQPYNVALIVDATGSMFSPDPYCPQPGSNAEQCAMNGVQTLLSEINPCINGVKSCPSGTSPNAVFRVALFSFPNISMKEVSKDWCGASGSSVAFHVYSFPALPSVGSTAGYGPNGHITYKISGVSTDLTYLITQHTADTANIDANGFTSDYFDASGTNNLKASSILVKAVGNGSANSCMKEPIGYPYMNWSAGYVITYQAGVIYAAQAALYAEQVLTTGLGIKATNVIIFVSDGQANATTNMFVPSTATITYGNGYVKQTGKGTYPDSTQDCQQTMMAAQYAIGQGTRVYGVAYGTEAGGCATDNKIVATGNLNVPVSNPATPCQVMENVSADYTNNPSQWYFYAEGQSEANGCTPTGTTTTNLTNIFQAISSTLTGPRLIANNAT
jgi:Flp pilus assembly protein TadG